MYKCPQMSNLVVTDWLSWIMCHFMGPKTTAATWSCLHDQHFWFNMGILMTWSIPMLQVVGPLALSWGALSMEHLWYLGRIASRTTNVPEMSTMRLFSFSNRFIHLFGESTESVLFCWWNMVDAPQQIHTFKRWDDLFVVGPLNSLTLGSPGG